MFHKFFFAALLLIAAINAAFCKDCSQIKCSPGEKAVCGLAVGEDCYVKLSKCALDRLTCMFGTKYEIVSDGACNSPKSLCF